MVRHKQTPLFYENDVLKNWQKSLNNIWFGVSFNNVAGLLPPALLKKGLQYSCFFEHLYTEHFQDTGSGKCITDRLLVNRGVFRTQLNTCDRVFCKDSISQKNFILHVSLGSEYTSQPAMSCSKLTIRTLEQGVKYVQS